jgi:hypothetical protein
MHIGIDFDNTIVSYDNLFHKVALEQNLITPDVPRNKVAVRDHLRRAGKEQVWVEMQGYVYGARMPEAEIFQGFIDFVSRARAAGHRTTIVSHKTRTPFAGPQYDLHDAARAWIYTHLTVAGESLFEEPQFFFELTKEAKFARIQTLACDVFVDDLPEILMAESMPRKIRKILFDPESNHATVEGEDLKSATTWDQVGMLLDV